MKELTSTLLADGSSDRALIPLLQMLLGELCNVAIADIAMANTSISNTLALDQRIALTLAMFPSEILFVHRDAETQSCDQRVAEIARAAKPGGAAKLICVVPVRMTEAWLLTQEAAIRRAVGNPRGTVALNLPQVARLEGVPDPKEELFQRMRLAVDKSARRMRAFVPEQHRHKVAQHISDLSNLRKLHSFMHLENQLRDYFKTRT